MAEALVMHALKLLSGRPHSRGELSLKLLRVCERKRRRAQFVMTQTHALSNTPLFGAGAAAGAYNGLAARAFEPLEETAVARTDAQYSAPEPCCKALTARALESLEAGGHLLEDAAYAKWHVAARAPSVGRPRSKLQLGAELFSKRVDGAAANAAMEEGHSELESAQAAAMRRPAATGPELSKHLRYKGFRTDVITRVVGERLRGQRKVEEIEGDSAPVARVGWARPNR